MAIGGGGGGMGRLLGLGFLFGAKDKGTTRVTKDIGSGFDQIAESVDRVGKQTTGLQRFNAAIGTLNFLQLDRMGDALEGLAQKAGIGEAAQANELETWGIQFGKAYREATAGMGSMRKEVDKYKKAIGGVAFTLEIDAGEMTKGIALITKSGNALEDYGLTVREVGGLTQAGILSSEQLANVMTSLSNSYGLGAKGAGKLVDEIAALAEQTGAGADAIRAMPEAIKAADAAMASLPEGMTGNVQDMLKSLTILAASSQRVLGGPYEDAFQAATDVMQKMTESRLELARTFTGLGGEFPELASRLAESYGSVDKAFEMMAGDPATFIKEIQKVYASLDETRRFRLLEQLPESIKFMVRAGGEGAKVIEEMQKPIEGAEGALGKMAKAASGSTRTFAESMELLEARFDNTLKRMAKWDKGVNYDREVINRTRRVYDRWGERIKKLTEGPLGGLIKFFLRVKRYGFVNALSTQIDILSEKGGKMGAFFNKIKDYVPFLDDLGDVLLDVGKAAVVLAGLHATGTLSKMGAALKGMGKVITGVNPWLVALAVAGIVIYKNWDVIGPMLKEIGDVLSVELGPAFEEIGYTAEAVWGAMKEGANAVWGDLLGFGKWFMKNLPDMIAGGAEWIVKTIVGMKFVVKSAAIMMAGYMMVLGKSAKAVGVFIKEGIGGALDWVMDVADGFFTSFEVGWMKLGRVMKQAVVNLLEIVQFLVDNLPKSALEMVGLGGITESFSKGVGETIRGMRKDIEILDKDIEGKEDARRRRNAKNESEGMKRLSRMEAAGMDVRKEFALMGREEAKLIGEAARGIERAEVMGDRIRQNTADALARRGEEVPKKEKRKRRRGRTVEAARAEAGAEAQYALSARGGYGEANLSEFMRTGDMSLSRDGEKSMSRAMFTAILDAQRKTARGSKGNAPDGGPRDLLGG